MIVPRESLASVNSKSLLTSLSRRAYLQSVLSRIAQSVVPPAPHLPSLAWAIRAFLDDICLFSFLVIAASSPFKLPCSGRCLVCNVLHC